MKKQWIISALLSITASVPLSAQWSGSSTTDATIHNGNVGIGTSTASAHKLNIENSVSDYSFRLKNINDTQEWLIGSSASNWGSGAGKLVFTGTGYSGTAILTLLPLKVGINNVSPKAVLDVGSQSSGVLASALGRVSEGDGTNDGSYLGVRVFGTQPSNVKSFSLEHAFYGQVNTSINFFRGASYADGFITFNTAGTSERMRILSNGNVCIGNTVSNGYKLAVEGTIGAREVNVNTTTWSDYVFNTDYKLLPLTEVEKYIAANHHLPEVPSAAEVEEKGINVGEMNALLLKKIEELTLHVIEQEKRIKELESRK